MKKIISLLLVMVLVLGLCACGEKKPAAKTPAETGKAPEGKLLVGFGRSDISISPSDGIDLVGYGGNGTPPTKMTGIMDRVYGTCIAITDSDGNTALIYTVDTLGTSKAEVDLIREGITAKTGIPGSNIVISGIHTHASYSTSQYAPYTGLMVQAAVDALADRAVSTVQSGSTIIENLNFVRYYTTQSGIVVGDNFEAAASASPRVKHTTDPDRHMPMIRFVREGDKKDVLMVNWQAHPKLGSTSETSEGFAQRSLLSADFIGFTRMNFEQETGMLFAYYTGAAGNLNPLTRMSSEMSMAPRRVSDYGAELSKQIIAGMENLAETEAGKVVTAQQMFPVVPTEPTRATEMELTAIRVGSIGFTTVPFEMFDMNGKFIKDNSPCETTFVLTCASWPRHEYIPASEVWDYDTGNQVAYELSSCKHERGTAENVSNELVKMLTDLG